MLKLFKTITAVSAMALMTACGGGGGGGGGGANTTAPVASTSIFPIMTVYMNTLTSSSSNNYTISGSISGVAIKGSGTVTYGNLSAGTFEGVAAQQRTTTATGSVVANGISIPLNSSSINWVDSNYVPKGSSSGIEYVVVMGTPTIPTAARVNDTGTLYTAKRYTNSTKSVLLGTDTATYVLEADTATTALLTFILTENDNQGNITSTSTEQLRITPTGTYTSIKDTLLQGTTNITVTY